MLDKKYVNLLQKMPKMNLQIQTFDILGNFDNKNLNNLILA